MTVDGEHLEIDMAGMATLGAVDLLDVIFWLFKVYGVLGAWEAAAEANALTVTA